MYLYILNITLKFTKKKVNISTKIVLYSSYKNDNRYLLQTLIKNLNPRDKKKNNFYIMIRKLITQKSNYKRK